jgi:hypothetical protein
MCYNSYNRGELTVNDDYRNATRRYRRRLAKALTLQAEIVSESHSKEDTTRMHAALDRMLKTIMELRVDERDAQTRRVDFIEHLKHCAYGAAYVEQDDEQKNLLIVEGTFDLSKLSKRMVWGSYEKAEQEELREIHDDCR